MFILTNWISTTKLGYLHRLLIPPKRERPHVDWESSHPIFFDGFATCHFHSTWQRWDEHAWTMLKPSSNGTTKKKHRLFLLTFFLIRTWRLPPLWYEEAAGHCSSHDQFMFQSQTNLLFCRCPKRQKTQLILATKCLHPPSTLTVPQPLGLNLWSRWKAKRLVSTSMWTMAWTDIFTCFVKTLNNLASDQCPSWRWG